MRNFCESEEDTTSIYVTSWWPRRGLDGRADDDYINVRYKNANKRGKKILEIFLYMPT